MIFRQARHTSIPLYRNIGLLSKCPDKCTANLLTKLCTIFGANENFSSKWSLLQSCYKSCDFFAAKLLKTMSQNSNKSCCKIVTNTAAKFWLTLLQILKLQQTFAAKILQFETIRNGQYRYKGYHNVKFIGSRLRGLPDNMKVKQNGHILL